MHFSFGIFLICSGLWFLFGRINKNYSKNNPLEVIMFQKGHGFKKGTMFISISSLLEVLFLLLMVVFGFWSVIHYTSF